MVVGPFEGGVEASAGRGAVAGRAAGTLRGLAGARQQGRTGDLLAGADHRGGQLRRTTCTARYRGSSTA